ncbi:DUF4157 domain-containing protein [Embleya sp. NPDC050154]|uniref:eCIS core domain-containing protein n=1 Tax=Embleya sp. NPDC050154 TaxID=3363988 RepID=UPI0037ADA33F
MASSPKAGGDGGSHLPAELESRAERARPLDASVRGPMERSFGASLGDVVVHTDADAAASADRLDAKAYAVGRHVVFGPGRYDPHSDAGRALIGHELAHVVQQRRGGVAPGPGGVHPSGTAAEGAAHRAGARAAAGLSAPVAGGTAPGVSRAPKGEEDPEVAALKAENRAADLRNLGVAEGIVLEGAAIVDTVVGFRYSVQDLEQRGVDNLASALGLGAEGKARLQVASDLLTGGAVLRAVRDEAKAAGLVDPVTGSPAVSSRVTAAGDWLEAKYDENMGTRAPRNDDLFTDRELGQIIGQLTAKTVLTAIDVEEVAVALAAVNVIGAVRSILDAVNADPDGWPSDVHFWTQVVAAVLTVAGMRAGSANKKIAMLLIDAALAGLTLAPVVKRLVTDWRRPAGADRDAALERGAKDLAKALLALLHQILLQAAASRRAKAGGAPPAAGAASGAAKAGPTTGKQPASHGDPHAATPPQAVHAPLATPAPVSVAHVAAPATPAVPAGAPKAGAAKPAAKPAPGRKAVAKRTPRETTSAAAVPAAGTPETAGAGAAGPVKATSVRARPAKKASTTKPSTGKASTPKSSAGKVQAEKAPIDKAQAEKAPRGAASSKATEQAHRQQLKETRARAKELHEELRRDKDGSALDRLEALYRGQSDRVLRALEKGDPVAGKVLEQRRAQAQQAELKRLEASGFRPPHDAIAKVVDKDGHVVSHKPVHSGGSTKERRREVGLIKANQEVHTEAKAVRNIPLKAGQTMYISGQYDPCGPCRSTMQAAADRTGARINYQWQGGPAGGITFTPTPRRQGDKP